MIRWNLTGTPSQIAIAREAFNRIKFPFDRLMQLSGTPELGWADLNTGRYMETARLHGTDKHDGDKPDRLEGTDEQGRHYTMGLIYTMSGRIYIDYRMESRPEEAMAVIGAELAHGVDFFLPMKDAQRNELLRLWGKGGTWWEVSDYGSEYFRLGGEAFMGEFVAAYSDLPFDRSPFLHDAGVEPADVRRILGIERTDYVPPIVNVSYNATVYHRPTHYNRPGKAPVGRPCKVCKP